MQYIQQAHIDTFTLIIEIKELESQTLVYIKKRVSRDEIKRYAERKVCDSHRGTSQRRVRGFEMRYRY